MASPPTSPSTAPESPRRSLARRVWLRYARRRLDRALLDSLEELTFADCGHGYDAFGANRDWVTAGVAATAGLYKSWFRVLSYGSYNIPAEGGVIVAANHSGTLPWDGAMLYSDIVRHTSPPRLPRVIADLFVPRLPIVGTTFARLGVVSGSRRNFKKLLMDGELIVVFPEGTPGIGKPFADRYKLQQWRQGHVELSILHQVPVLPVGIIGPEEQMPQLARLENVHPFGAPYLPIPATPFPLPVRYHIHYGEPLRFFERYEPEQADDPEVTRVAALEVKANVQALLDEGLAEREGVFA